MDWIRLFLQLNLRHSRKVIRSVRMAGIYILRKVIGPVVFKQLRSLLGTGVFNSDGMFHSGIPEQKKAH